MDCAALIFVSSIFLMVLKLRVMEHVSIFFLFPAVLCFFEPSLVS